MGKCSSCNDTGSIDSFKIEQIGESSFQTVRKTKTCLCQKQVIFYPTDEQVAIELLKTENHILRQHIATLEGSK